MDLNLVRRLEEISLNALPARQTVIDDGWVLRLTGGGTGRANAAYPLYGGTDDLAARIERVEGVYRGARLAPMFKLTPAARPTELEVALIARGYKLRGADTQVQIARLDAPLEPLWPADTSIELVRAVTGEWLEAFGATHANWSPEDMSLKRWMLEAIATPAIFALVRRGGAPVGVGTAIVDGDWVGLFDIALVESARGNGLSLPLSQALLSWGFAQGARRAYLQVVVDNAPALRTYARLGFQGVYSYWYRRLSADC